VSGNPEAGLVGFGLSRPPGHARRSERPLSGKREEPRQRPLLAANAPVTACEIPVYPSRPRVRVTKAYR
jgi:hypothetical protein